MKLKSKILSLCLALAMALTTVSMPVFPLGGGVVKAANESGTNAYGEDGISWTLDSDGVLTISGSGPMGDPNKEDDFEVLFDDDYDEGIAFTWYEYRDKITKVVIKEGVTSITEYAFASATNIVEVEIAASVDTIGEFILSDDVKSLNTIKFAKRKSAPTKIEKYAFPIGSGDTIIETYEVLYPSDATGFSKGVDPWALLNMVPYGPALDKSFINLDVGRFESLSPNADWKDAGITTYSWTTSSAEIVAFDENGADTANTPQVNVYARKGGTAKVILTTTCTSGTITKECEIRVSNIPNVTINNNGASEVHVKSSINVSIDDVIDGAERYAWRATFTDSKGESRPFGDASYKVGVNENANVWEFSAPSEAGTIKIDAEVWAADALDKKLAKGNTTITVEANHVNETITAEVPATCAVSGKTEIVRCKKCNEIYGGEVIPATGKHIYEVVNGSKKAATCTVAGKEADQKCKVCAAEIKGKTIPATGHKEVSKVTKATTKANGKITYTCSVCKETTKKATAIASIDGMTINKSSFVYNKKAQKPTVSVKDSKGKTIAASNYTVSYSKGSKDVGKYTVTVKFKGNYDGKLTKSYTIVPKATKIASLTKAKKAFTAKWDKQDVQTDGYEIAYSTDMNFKANNTKTVTIKKTKTVSKKISGLKAGQKYYVKVRTYKTVDKKPVYSSWSAVKNVTTKAK